MQEVDWIMCRADLRNGRILLPHIHEWAAAFFDVVSALWLLERDAQTTPTLIEATYVNNKTRLWFVSPSEQSLLTKIGRM